MAALYVREVKKISLPKRPEFKGFSLALRTPRDMTGHDDGH